MKTTAAKVAVVKPVRQTISRLIQQPGYVKAYEECLAATSTHEAPWWIVPADDKENARLVVSQIVLDAFEALDLRHPKTSPKRIQELQAMRKELTK